MVTFDGTGEDLSLTDGDEDRTLTISANAIDIRPYVDGTRLGEDQWTFLTGTLTFNLNTWDRQTIVVDYTTSIAESANYCSADNVSSFMGLGTGFFTTTSTPTLTEVNDFILDAQDDIDRIAQHSWRETQITDEFHNFPDLNAITNNTTYQYGAGMRISTKNRKIRTMDTDEGDKLEVWNGSEYEDYITSRSEGRSSDFWFDYEAGVLYLKSRWKTSKEKAVRMTYRFGESSVPRDIKRAAVLNVAMNITLSSDSSQTLNETGDFKTSSYDSKYDKWEKKYKEIMMNRKEIKLITF